MEAKRIAGKLAVYDKDTGKWRAPAKDEFRGGADPKKIYTSVRGKIVEKGSAGEVILKAREQAEAEAKAKEEQIRTENLSKAEAEAKLQEIKQEQTQREIKLQRGLAYQQKVKEEGGVRITGGETAKEIKELSQASGISEREIAQEVKTQEFKKEVATSLLTKQAEKKIPELRKSAEYIFKQEPERDIVRIKEGGVVYEFRRGEPVKSSGAVYSALKPEEFVTTKQITTQKEADKYFYEKESPKRAKFFIPVEEAQDRYKLASENTGIFMSYTSFIAGTSAGVIGLAKSIIHPVKTVKGLVYTATHPFEVGAQVGEKLQTDPVYFFGEVTGFVAGSKVIGLGIKGAVKGVKGIYKGVGKFKTQQYATTYEPVRLQVGKTSVTQKIQTDLKPGQLTEYQRGYLGYEYGTKAQPVTVGSIKAGVGLKGVKGSQVGVGKTSYINLQTKKYDIYIKQKPTLKIDNTAKVSYPGYESQIKYFKKGTNKLISTKTIFTQEGLRPTTEVTAKFRSVEGVNWKKLLTSEEYIYKEGVGIKTTKFKQSFEIVKQATKTKTKQVDTATNYELLQKTYKLKGEPSILYEIKQPEIIYSKSPTYESNIFKIKPSAETITTTTIKQPTLRTAVKSTGVTKTLYESETGFKPLGKKAGLQLGGVTETIPTKQIITPIREVIIKPEVNVVSGQFLESVIKFAPTKEIKIGFFPLVTPETEIKTEMESRIKTDVKIIPSFDLTPETLTKTKPETIVKTTPDIKTSTSTKSKQETLQEQIIETEPITDVIEITTPKQPPSRSFFKTVTEPPPPIPPTPIKREFDIFEPKGLFSVKARRRGVFKEIAKAESIEEAFAKGSYFVDVTSSASFKIDPLGFEFDVGGKAKTLLPSIFRESKREAGVFIEKRKYRISTPGEKAEITERGLFALKSKGFKL